MCGGKFTGADLLCAWVLEEVWEAEMCGVREYEGVAGWLERVRGREAYNIALKEVSEGLCVVAGGLLMCGVADGGAGEGGDGC